MSGITCIFTSENVGKGETVHIKTEHEGGTTDSGITRVEFRASTIYSIPPELFTTFRNLKRLTMVGQGLRTKHLCTRQKLEKSEFASQLVIIIDEDTLKGADNLIGLLLGFNGIKNIDGKSFSHCPKLYGLELGGNQLTSFHENTLNNLGELHEFSLWSNQVTTLHQNTFRDTLCLERLHLEASKLRVLSKTIFSQLTKLDHLSLAGNYCIDKDYLSNAFENMATIEQDLLNCTVAYF
jgi:Leucine-rich repeat (LRR) protein